MTLRVEMIGGPYNAIWHEVHEGFPIPDRMGLMGDEGTAWYDYDGERMIFDQVEDE